MEQILHRTFKIIDLLHSLKIPPTELFAMHEYIPLSSKDTFLRINMLLITVIVELDDIMLNIVEFKTS